MFLKLRKLFKESTIILLAFISMLGISQICSIAYARGRVDMCTIPISAVLFGIGSLMLVEYVEEKHRENGRRVTLLYLGILFTYLGIALLQF